MVISAAGTACAGFAFLSGCSHNPEEKPSFRKLLTRAHGK